VNAVIIEKTHKEGERPDWLPTTLAEVTDDVVNHFFDPASTYLASAPQIEVPESFIRDDIPVSSRYALPTEAEIGQAVYGSHASGGATSLRLDELVARFVNLRQGKMGVREKVLEVARRRCSFQDNADGNSVWLKWRHQPTPP
jgi:3-hydroxyisobutyryl-CoA hydrolase